MARLTITELRSKWKRLLSSVVQIRERASPGTFKDSLDVLIKESGLERPLNDYIILDRKSVV